MPKYLYPDNDGGTHRITLSQASATAGGFTQGSSPSSKIPAKVSKTNKEFGLRPRMLALSRPTNPGPTDKIYRHNLPIASQSTWNSSTPGTTINYDGESWIVTQQIPEDYS